ncbi:MAG TPA: radical SAM protein [Burkholderiales bacterium]|nr:radical SAM protein [Burkholderiales bacterium]
MQGRAVSDYGAPLFFAWQLTNRCGARCVACCEESGPDRAWRDELGRAEALDLARRIVDFGIPYAAFGGGEPLSAPHCWELFEVLAAGGVALKIETDGSFIDDAAATRMARLGVQCVQISVDGASAETHQRMRPGASFDAATGAIRRLAARGLAPQMVFAPARWNLREITAAYDLAVELGCGAFVTGPLMRIGRAAADWERLACSDEDWQAAVAALREHARARAAATVLSIYPWDILTEMKLRLDSPQAMLLAVPNGKVKLLNALPFAAADLRRDSLEQAWRAYRAGWESPRVREFVERCGTDPGLLRHANETWALDTA